MPLLIVERLSKSFGKVRAVNELSFEVREGEIVGLLGPNGVGKTTWQVAILARIVSDCTCTLIDRCFHMREPYKAKACNA